MTKETKQPFTGDKQRNPADQELVAEVLGTTEAAEMEELLGQDKPSETESTPLATEVDLSENEQRTVGEAEKTEAEKCRQEYYVWAGKIGKDDDWVDNTFTFNTDGTVIAESSVDLRNLKIDTLPPRLVEVAGDFYLNHNQITSLENMPNTVSGDLYLNNNQIISLESLPGTIDGDLSLWKNPATSIPEELNITGKIYLNADQTELIEDCEAKEYAVIVTW